MDSKTSYHRSRSPETHKSRTAISRPSSEHGRPRRALHERTQSQNNSSPTRGSRIYDKTPFPQLPSQLFPPRSGPYIFNDENSSIELRPIVPPRSPHRPLTPSSSNGSLNRQGHDYADILHIPRLPPLDVRRDRDARTRGRPESARTFEDIFGPAMKGRQKSILRKPAPDQRPLKAKSTTSPDTFAARKRRQHSRSRDRNQLPVQPKSPKAHSRSHAIDDATPIHKSVERVKPRSNVMTAKGKEHARTPSKTPGSQPERPRSASSPGTPTEAFIQTLMHSPTNIQYPKIRQPSVNSLRSQSSSARVPYPAPLRLQRKRAVSQLGRVASENGLISAPNVNYSKISLASQSTLDPPVIPLDRTQLSFDPQRASSNWADEAGDIVPELDKPTLWRHKSDYTRQSLSDSRPTTRDSSKTGKATIYTFLNDSKTAWANIYYGNDSRVWLETPPRVTQPKQVGDVSQHHTPNPSASDTQSLSPGSAGFPDSLYVKRFRPHAYSNQASYVPSTSSLRYSSSLSTMRTLHHSASTSLGGTATTATGNPYARDSHETPEPITALPPMTPVTPPHNATPPLAPIPHLSPDKRHGSRLLAWRAPSVEDADTKRHLLFGRANRQITLFCMGFVFPLAWWLASVLPLPRRPRMQGPEMRESGVGAWEGDATAASVGELSPDLFMLKEVSTYQKARWWRMLNRVMSVVGLGIIAAVIACAVVATH